VSGTRRFHWFYLYIIYSVYLYKHTYIIYVYKLNVLNYVHILLYNEPAAGFQRIYIYNKIVRYSNRHRKCARKSRFRVAAPGCSDGGVCWTAGSQWVGVGRTARVPGILWHTCPLYRPEWTPTGRTGRTPSKRTSSPRSPEIIILLYIIIIIHIRLCKSHEN